MNRRQFLTASIITSVFAVLFSRRDTAAEYKPEPPPTAGMCLEYIPAPVPDKERHTVHVPIATNDD